MSVLRKRAGAVCLRDGRILVVRLKDPVAGTVYPLPPGGGIEPGETPWQAAERECYEETGFKVRSVAHSEVIVPYQFYWNGKHNDCVTHFFRVELVKADPDPITDAEYLVAVEWLPLHEIKKELNFPGIIAALSQLSQLP